METPIKVRKTRTRKEVNPQIASLKKSVSAALKAAWNVDALKVRQEKAVRAARASLEGKVQEQREALEKIKVAVDAFLLALAPSAAPITPVKGDLEAGTLASTFCEAEPVSALFPDPALFPEAELKTESVVESESSAMLESVVVG